MSAGARQRKREQERPTASKQRVLFNSTGIHGEATYLTVELRAASGTAFYGYL